MPRRECQVCGHIVEEEKWIALPKDWCCPVCESGKSYFTPMGETAEAETRSSVKQTDTTDIGELHRISDEMESYMEDQINFQDAGLTWINRD